MFFFFLGSGLIATLPDCWMRQVDGGCWIRDVDWMRFGLTASSIARKNAENDDRGGEIGGRGGGGDRVHRCHFDITSGRYVQTHVARFSLQNISLARGRWLYTRMDKGMDIGMDEYMDGWIFGWISGWIFGWIDGWMD